MEHAKLNGLVGLGQETLNQLSMLARNRKPSSGGPFSAVTLQGVSGYPELGRVGHDYWADCKRSNRRRWCSSVGSNGVRACTHSGAEK